MKLIAKAGHASDIYVRVTPRAAEDMLQRKPTVYVAVPGPYLQAGMRMLGKTYVFSLDEVQEGEAFETSKEVADRFYECSTNYAMQMKRYAPCPNCGRATRASERYTYGHPRIENHVCKYCHTYLPIHNGIVPEETLSDSAKRVVAKALQGHNAGGHERLALRETMAYIALALQEPEPVTTLQVWLQTPEAKNLAFRQILPSPELLFQILKEILSLR